MAPFHLILSFPASPAFIISLWEGSNIVIYVGGQQQNCISQSILAQTHSSLSLLMSCSITLISSPIHLYCSKTTKREKTVVGGFTLCSSLLSNEILKCFQICLSSVITGYWAVNTYKTIIYSNSSTLVETEHRTHNCSEYIGRLSDLVWKAGLGQLYFNSSRFRK